MPNNQNSSPLKKLAFIRNGTRAKEIIFVLIRNGFSEILDKILISKFFGIRHIVPVQKNKLTIWQRIRIVCEELGPTFIKFAQILSTREDILPPQLIEEFKKLRDQVTPLKWEEIETVLDEEIHGGIHTYFSEFDKRPRACGSIGQVYFAKLNSGEAVAVKIRRPGAGRMMRSDFEILKWLLEIAIDKFPEIRPYDPMGILEEISNEILREIDFTFEAKNLNYFKTINKDSQIFTPTIFSKLSSERVLVTSWVYGKAPGDPSIPQELAKTLANHGGKSIFTQIFTLGFFHADPHPGNILITDDNRLCFLDWGCTGTLSKEMRYFLADLFVAVAEYDPEKVLHIILKRRPPKERIDKSKIISEIGLVLRKHPDLHTNASSVGHLIFDILRVFSKNQIPLPRDYALLAKSILVVEESGKLLDANFDVTAFAQEALKNLYTERHNLKNISKSFLWESEHSLAYIKEMPQSLQRIFWKIENGDIKINIDHEGLNATRITMDKSANRMSLALIIAALLVASALLVCSAAIGDKNTFSYNLGIAGFIIAALWTLWLIWIIVWRRNK